MEKIDLRKLSDKDLEKLHKTAINLIKKGNRKGKVAEIIGCSPRSITSWWKDYTISGCRSVKPKTRGRKEGEQRRLTKSQENEIQKKLNEKYPEQLKLPYALWTRQAVKELILVQFGVDLPVRTVGDYLKRWGFTPQKPVQRTFEQAPVQAQKWLSEKYPSIKARAKKEHAEVQWCNETGFSGENYQKQSHFPQAETPGRYGEKSRFGTSMISATNNMGKMQWVIYKGIMNIDLFIKFLQKIIKDANRKVFLIVDKLCTQYSGKIKEWLLKHNDEIELFYFS